MEGQPHEPQVLFYSVKRSLQQNLHNFFASFKKDPEASFSCDERMKPDTKLSLNHSPLKGCLKRSENQQEKRVKWAETVEVKPILKETWDSGEEVYAAPMSPEKPGVENAISAGQDEFEEHDTDKSCIDEDCRDLKSYPQEEQDVLITISSDSGSSSSEAEPQPKLSDSSSSETISESSFVEPGQASDSDYVSESSLSEAEEDYGIATKRPRLNEQTMIDTTKNQLEQ